MELPFEIFNCWGEDQSYQVDEVVPGETDNWGEVVLAGFVLLDVGEDVGVAEVGEVGEHEVEAEDYCLFHYLGGEGFLHAFFFGWVIYLYIINSHITVSYTHLTLPTIYSV